MLQPPSTVVERHISNSVLQEFLFDNLYAGIIYRPLFGFEGFGSVSMSFTTKRQYLCHPRPPKNAVAKLTSQLNSLQFLSHFSHGSKQAQKHNIILTHRNDVWSNHKLRSPHQHGEQQKLPQNCGAHRPCWPFSWEKGNGCAGENLRKQER